MGNTASNPEPRTYSLEQAQRDFGPCGKLQFAMNSKKEKGEPFDMDLVFSMEACLKQHLGQYTYDEEQTLKMQTMLLVFGEPGPNTPPKVVAARERAHKVNWLEKIKEEI